MSSNLISLLYLDSAKNTVIIDPSQDMKRGNIVNFLKVLNAISNWMRMTKNIGAFVVGEEMIINKISKFDHFSVLNQPLLELLDTRLVKKKSWIVLIHASIQQLYAIRQKLKQNTVLVFIPTEDRWENPALSNDDMQITVIYDRRFLQFLSQSKWWISTPYCQPPIPFFLGFSSNGFVHELYLFQVLLEDLAKNEKYQEIEDILAYLYDRYSNFPRVINLHGIYYLRRAIKETEEPPIKGPYVDLAEEKLKTALALEPSEAEFQLGLIMLYSYSNQTEKLKELWTNMLPLAREEILKTIQKDPNLQVFMPES